MEEIALDAALPRFDPQAVWSQLVGGPAEASFLAAIGRAIVSRRWFGAKTRTIQSLEILDALPLSIVARLMLLQLEFANGPAEIYQVPLTLATGDRASWLLSEQIASLWARIRVGDGPDPVVLVDALNDAAVQRELLYALETAAPIQGIAGELVGWRTSQFVALRGATDVDLPPQLVGAEQSNSSIVYGDRLILKVFRRVEMGINPDVEICTRLTDRGFERVPPLAGGLEYCSAGREPWTLAMAQGFVPNQGDAWQNALRRLKTFVESMLTDPQALPGAVRLPVEGLSTTSESPLPSGVARAFPDFAADIERLGTRTAQMHLELAAGGEDPAFQPELFSEDDRRAWAARARELTRETFELLREQGPRLAVAARKDAANLLPLEPVVHERFDRLAEYPAEVFKIRGHGDYHLGQVLVAGDDFYVIDFEGEPARPLSERRQKQLALRDVAGMIRSFHYAGCSTANELLVSAVPHDAQLIEQWTGAWYFWMSVAFLSAYRRAAHGAPFLPSASHDFEQLFGACLLEKAIYELRYELNNRPDWVYLPLRALHEILGNRNI